MPTAYINIGSNQGDRRANIARAVALIADTLNIKPQLSSAIESEPWGYNSDSPYLNIGLVFDTSAIYLLHLTESPTEAMPTDSST